MQHRRNGQTVKVKVNIKTGERNKHVTIAKRKGISDQIAEQNHSNQEMIQEDTIVTTTRGNPSTEHIIIVRKKAINKLNVELGSIT